MARSKKKWVTRDVRFYLTDAGFMAMDAAVPGLSGEGPSRLDALTDLTQNIHEMTVANSRSARDGGDAA